ncbi:Uncharacterised protein [Burkholderia pseudomallei]|nr:Uncharacterised protein [Burkholderia pseudomallei]CAJ6704972.1 Uncharacterised protein [Burkholderia pseudomallei]
MGAMSRIAARSALLLVATTLAGGAPAVYAHAARVHGDTNRSLSRHDTFRSPIPDGTLDGAVDFADVHFVPAKGRSGYLVPIPAQGDFDSVRINVRVSHAGTSLGIVRGGIVYWRQGRPVVAFGGLEGSGGQIIPVRGYFEVAALVPNPAAQRGFKAGETILLARGAEIRVPLIIDHAEIPPSDAEDDD